MSNIPRYIGGERPSATKNNQLADAARRNRPVAQPGVTQTPSGWSLSKRSPSTPTLSFHIHKYGGTAIKVIAGQWTLGNKQVSDWNSSVSWTVSSLSAASETYTIIATVNKYGDRRADTGVYRSKPIDIVALAAGEWDVGSSWGDPDTIMIVGVVTTNSDGVINSVTASGAGGDITTGGEITPFKIIYVGTDATNHHYRVRRGWWYRNGNICNTVLTAGIDYVPLTTTVGRGGDYQVVATLNEAFKPTELTIATGSNITPGYDPDTSSTTRTLGIIRSSTLHYWIEQFVNSHIDDTWGYTGSYVVSSYTITVENGIIISREPV